MSLAKSYCKEISRELDQIAVYLPGSQVMPGDVITFGHGLFQRPFGSFDHVSSLGNLNVPFSTKNETHPDPYKYASKGGVSISFTADATVGTVGKGKLDINFTKEGSIYLAAIDCITEHIEDITDFPKLLNPHKNRIDWENCYIVTAVTTASKAIIMQSNSKSAKLSLSGNVNSLQLDQNLKFDAGTEVQINSYKDSSFIKEWSPNVQIFMKLVKYRKKISGNWNVKSFTSLLETSEFDEFEILDIHPIDLLEEL